jgi:hypothetical protein
MSRKGYQRIKQKESKWYGFKKWFMEGGYILFLYVLAFFFFIIGAIYSKTTLIEDYIYYSVIGISGVLIGIFSQDFFQKSNGKQFSFLKFYSQCILFGGLGFWFIVFIINDFFSSNPESVSKFYITETYHGSRGGYYAKVKTPFGNRSFSILENEVERANRFGYLNITKKKGLFGWDIVTKTEVPEK